MWFCSIIIFHLVAIITFFGYAIFDIEIKGGIVTYLIIISFSVLKISQNKKTSLSLKLGILDLLISTYVIWNLITLVNVLILEKSIDIYAKGITYTLFPISGYIIFSFQNNRFDINIINKYFIILVVSTMLTILSGISFMILPTEFYFKYILKLFEGKINDMNILWVARLISYFGDSAVVGNISTISIPLIIYLRSQKIKYFRSHILYLSFLVVAYSGVILSFARSAWVTTILITIFYIVNEIKKNAIWIAVIMLFLFSLISFSAIEIIETDSEYLAQLEERIFSISESFSERYYQIEYALNIIKENPLGLGLGQAGHKSFAGDKYIGVYDNNYLRIFTETGVVGLFLFLIIMFLSIFLLIYYIFSSGFKAKLNLAIGCALFTFYFQALGSNVFDIHYSSFLFWSFLGILSLKNKWINQRPLKPIGQ